MKTIKAVLMNPYLLGIEGFVVGALLLWAAPSPIQPAEAAVPVAAVQLVPSVS